MYCRFTVEDMKTTKKVGSRKVLCQIMIVFINGLHSPRIPKASTDKLNPLNNFLVIYINILYQSRTQSQVRSEYEINTVHPAI